MNKSILFFLLLLVVVLFVRVHIAVFYPAQKTTTDTVTTTVSGEVAMHFLDIGQGDATFMEFASGEQLLLDCAIDARILEALGRVMPVYDHTIDYLVVTHPDKDHYGGCIDVLDRFEVANIVYTGFEKDQAFFDVFMEYVQQEGAVYHVIEKEQTWSIASTTITFLYPDHSLEQNPHIPGLADKEIDANNTSLVLLFDIYGTQVLLTGDAEAPQERYLLERYGPRLDVAIYKAGHHGSSGSSIQEFIDVVTPSDTIFSAGRENSYGHPSPRVIKRVERLGSRIWRTDLNGDILVVITDRGYHVTPQHVFIK